MFDMLLHELMIQFVTVGPIDPKIRLAAMLRFLAGCMCLDIAFRYGLPMSGKILLAVPFIDNALSEPLGFSCNDAACFGDLYRYEDGFAVAIVIRW
jgi:hypothetical protein